MYRRYYSYSDMPQLVRRDDEKPKPKPPEKENCVKDCPPRCNNKLLGKFETDDVILGVVILALLLDDSDDSILLLALAIIFLTGIN